MKIICEGVFMKKYFVHYYENFGNTYHLYYTETEADVAALPKGAEQITRKQAEDLARDERKRRENDQEFAHNADDLIYPPDAPDDARYDWYHYTIRGYILERNNVSRKGHGANGSGV
jgi:hypothetical protein